MNTIPSLSNEKLDLIKIPVPEFKRPELIPQLAPHLQMLEQLKKQSNFIRDSTLFLNVYRTKINKKSPLFRVQECPFGFGYYAVNRNIELNFIELNIFDDSELLDQPQVVSQMFRVQNLPRLGLQRGHNSCESMRRRQDIQLQRLFVHRRRLKRLSRAFQTICGCLEH